MDVLCFVDSLTRVERRVRMCKSILVPMEEGTSSRHPYFAIPVKPNWKLHLILSDSALAIRATYGGP